MIRKILFPTDFSHAADNAFSYALQFAASLGAQITTLHVYSLPQMKADRLPNTLKSVYESMTIEAFENYRDNVPHLRAIADAQGTGHVPLKHVMLEQKASTEGAILHFAREAEADMIIIGTVGFSAVRNILLGSTASEVLENAHCPVLAVPLESHFDGRIDKIAMTTELTEQDTAALRRVIAMMEPFEPEIHCIHADTAHTEPLTHKVERYAAEFAGPDNVIFKSVNAMSVESALAEYAKRHRMDLIAMLTHKRNFFQELFTYSMTKKMALHYKIPVLAIQEHTLEAG